jgi:hypothetical protein
VSAVKNINDLAFDTRLKRPENGKIAEEDVQKKKIKNTNPRQ